MTMMRTRPLEAMSFAQSRCASASSGWLSLSLTITIRTLPDSSISSIAMGLLRGFEPAWTLLRPLHHDTELQRTERQVLEAASRCGAEVVDVADGSGHRSRDAD